MVELDKFMRMREQIAVKVVALDAEEYAELDKAMAIDFEEHFAFQQNQSEAFVSGLISQDVAQLVYSSLGESLNSENGGWSKGVDLSTKCLITKLMGELLERKVR